MSAKKKSLTSSMQRAANPSSEKLLESHVERPSKSPSSKTRRGTRLIGGHFPQEVQKQLKLMSVNQDKTIQVLLGEALNLLFEEYDKPPIA